MFWTVHLIGWLSPCLLVMFWSFDLFFDLGHNFLSQHTCYILRGGALGIYQGGATHLAVLWHCKWQRGPRGNNVSCSALSLLSVTSSTTHISKVGGFVYVLGPCGSLQQTLLCDWEFLPQPQPPQVFFSQRFWGFISLHWNPGLCGLSCAPVFLPVYLHANVGLTGLPAATSPTLVLHPLPCHGFSPPWLPLLPVWMNASSLTLWLLDTHTVWFSDSSGYFLFLNLLPFFWFCEEATCISMSPSWLKSSLHTFYFCSDI